MKIALFNMFMAGTMLPIFVSDIASNKPLWVSGITFSLFIGNLVCGLLNYRANV